MTGVLILVALCAVVVAVLELGQRRAVRRGQHPPAGGARPPVA